MRVVPITALALAAVVACSGQSSYEKRQTTIDECISSLSGFPKDSELATRLIYPTDLAGVTLEYSTSGCYGKCPAFTLIIGKDVAHFEGHAYTRAKGNRTKKLKPGEFEAFLRAWYDGRFYAMRENYCDVHCPDGTMIIVTDIPESSVTLITPEFSKRVYQCYSTVNNRPQTPKPPDEYLNLAREFWKFAKAKHWL